MRTRATTETLFTAVTRVTSEETDDAASPVFTRTISPLISHRMYVTLSAVIGQ